VSYSDELRDVRLFEANLYSGARDYGLYDPMRGTKPAFDRNT
jgi:hypothetical protein